MSQSASWTPYTGSGASILAVILFTITGALAVTAIRLPHPVTFKRPGKPLGALIVVMWFLAVLAFLTSA